MTPVQMFVWASADNRGGQIAKFKKKLMGYHIAHYFKKQYLLFLGCWVTTLNSPLEFFPCFYSLFGGFDQWSIETPNWLWCWVTLRQYRQRGDLLFVNSVFPKLHLSICRESVGFLTLPYSGIPYSALLWKFLGNDHKTSKIFFDPVSTGLNPLCRWGGLILLRPWWSTPPPW